jgi:hypothetical protein
MFNDNKALIARLREYDERDKLSSSLPPEGLIEAAADALEAADARVKELEKALWEIAVLRNPLRDATPSEKQPRT